jgi:signal transduction histidine kinase
MADAATATEKDPLLSHGAHEIRNPVAVILGYVRMLATERLGPLTDLQRKAVGDMATSTAKLAVLADEMSHLSRLQAGGVKMTRARVELAQLIAAEVPSVPPLPDREVGIRVIDNAPGAAVNGDAAKLRTVFNSLLFSYRRELVTSDELCVAIDRVAGEKPATRVTLGGADRIEELRLVPFSELVPLVEFRGGIGFKLSIARYLIEAHGGRILSKMDPGITPHGPPLLAGAALILPEA